MTASTSDSHPPCVNSLKIVREVVFRAINEVGQSNSAVMLAKTLYVDGTPLYKILGEGAKGLGTVLDLTPDFPSADSFALKYKDTTTRFADFGDVSSMGLALASGTVAPFPLAKIPLFTCCSSTDCGYVACTVEFTDKTVSWNGFGQVFPIYDSDQGNAGEEWKFHPLDYSPTFEFDRDAYAAEFHHWLPQPDLTVTTATMAAAMTAAIPSTSHPEDQSSGVTFLRKPNLSPRELDFAKQRLRSLERAQRIEFQGGDGPDPWWERALDFVIRIHFWPIAEDERLSELLVKHDPLHLKAHGPLNAWVYSDCGSQNGVYLKFIKSPHKKLTARLQKQFGVSPDPGRIETVVRDFLAPLRES